MSKYKLKVKLGKVNIMLNEDQISEIVRQDILRSISIVELLGGTEREASNDVSTWDALNEVLCYYSTPEQLAEYENRDIPDDWVNKVVLTDRIKRGDQAYDKLVMIDRALDRMAHLGV